MYSNTKSKDLFFFFFFLSATLYACGTHTRTGQRLCGWSPGRMQLVRAALQHVDCQVRVEYLLSALSIHETRGRKENKLSSFTRRTQTPAYPCSTCSLLSLKDLIHLCGSSSPRTTMHFQACTFPFSVSQSISLCTFLP